MFVAYSPICDTSETAYLKYLSLCEEFSKAVQDGAFDRLQLEPCRGGSVLVRGGHGCGVGLGVGRGANGTLGVVRSFGSCEECVAGVGQQCFEVASDAGRGEGNDSVRSVRDRLQLYHGSGTGVSQDSVDSGSQGVAVESLENNGTVDFGEAKVKGKHWAANQRKRAKQKAMKRSWRSVDPSGGCVSDESVASVRTVDTRTAVEIEAAQTLAARRVVENQLAIAKGRAQLRGFCDSAKTDAVNRLAAARMEQRINEAKAKSQASYKKCDESSRSLGSTGSAGEFAMRIEIQKAKESERMLKYVQEQADYFAKHASLEVLQHVHDMPSPEPVDAYEIFGDCSSDLSPHEAAAYYDELNRLNEESALRFARY